MDTVFGGIGSAFDTNLGKTTEDDSKEQDNSGEGLLGKVASGSASIFGKIKNTFNTKDSLGKSSGISGEIAKPDLKLPGGDPKEDDSLMGGVGFAFDGAKTQLTETAPEIQPTYDNGEGFFGAEATETSSVFGKVKNVFDGDATTQRSPSTGK